MFNKLKNFLSRHKRPSPPVWVVNDMGELGVEVNGNVYFMYKGESLEYAEGKRDDGTPILYRTVEKREFGETCIAPEANSDVPDSRRFYYKGQGWKNLQPQMIKD
tara:strand:+ start:5227 stop:5541 length:315 start_codon:yes stop_codon:yes gene_type:complete